MRYLSLPFSIILSVCFVAANSYAASKPRSDSEKPKSVWTNHEIEKLRARGLITFFNVPEAAPEEPAARGPYDKTKDPVWYADQAATLQVDLERARAELRQYRQTLDDARNLKRTTGGIALDQDTLAITPENGIEILERRAREVATQLDALGELARRNGFPPGLTRG